MTEGAGRAGATAAGGGAPRIDAARVIGELRELAELTGGPGGARRVCWGAEWRQAREWLAGKLMALGVEVERDEAGNVWSFLEGEREPALGLGSHLDSVPAGGWLDGALGVLAALGVLRAWSGAGARPPRTIALIDFADEEGARFGRSLFGSSALAGTLHPDELAGLRDAESRAISDVLAEQGVELDSAPRAAARLERLAAYIELHIEQGPVLETEGLPCAAVAGCAGVERERFRFRGQTGHAGTTPMDDRADAGLAAAATALQIERTAVRLGGMGTTGRIDLEPGIVTAVAGGATLSVDLRHPDAGQLELMLAEAHAAAGSHAEQRGCSFQAEPLWRIEPIPFDRELVELAASASAEAGGRAEPLTSGALHDAAEIARALPAAMIFSSSSRGLSHTKEEDTPEPDLLAAITAFGDLANRVLLTS